MPEIAGRRPSPEPVCICTKSYCPRTCPRCASESCFARKVREAGLTTPAREPS